MFSKALFIFSASVAVLVSAGKSNGRRDINNSCNAGPVQCCNQLYHSSSTEAASIHKAFSLDSPLSGMVGTQCSPISGAGAGSGANCQSQPVCCSNNHYEGLIVIGCSPININI